MGVHAKKPYLLPAAIVDDGQKLWNAGQFTILNIID